MSHQFHLFASPSAQRTNSPLFAIILMVIVAHVVLLALGTFWNPAPPPPKPRSKVIVQTVRLKPFQANTMQNPVPFPASVPVATPVSVPTEQPSQVETPLPQVPKEESLPPPEIAMQKEEPAPVSEAPVKKEEIPIVKETPMPKEEPVVAAPSEPAPPPPAPAKIENPPTPKPTDKAKVQEKPKTKAKQSAPVKKPIEPTQKSAKKENVKSKEAEEANKKRQQQEQAEKKRQQEKAEAEKKRQQEAEKKRQQEIAAAQEVAKQKLAKAKESLAKIGETSHKISAPSSVNLETTALPKELGSLQVDTLSMGDAGGSDWGSREASYSDEVAYRLKMALKLPDYGAVKIKLTLDRNGKVVKVETVQSESSKNKVYIESKIPTLLFPSFGQRFQGVSQKHLCDHSPK